MKLLTVLGLFISFSAFAQFRTTTTYSVSGSGAAAICNIGSYAIDDGGPLTGQKNMGRQLCADMGLLARPGGSSVSTLGTFFLMPGDISSNCQIRTAGGASGSVTCGAGYTGE